MFAQGASQEDQPLYTLEEVNTFLDEISIADYFLDKDKFERTLIMLQKTINTSLIIAGIAVLFTTAAGVNILHTEEIVMGRLLLVKAEIKGDIVYFLNVYSPNIGQERL